MRVLPLALLILMAVSGWGEGTTAGTETAESVKPKPTRLDAAELAKKMQPAIPGFSLVTNTDHSARTGRLPPTRTTEMRSGAPVCQLGLEGVVAKKRSGHYLPGRRSWIKVKNRKYWLEVASLERRFG